MDNWIELLFDGGKIATGVIAGIVANKMHIHCKCIENAMNM